MKKFFSILLAGALIIALAVPAMARDTNFTVGRSFTWSPYSSTDAFGGGVISGGSSQKTYITAWTDFHWDTTGASAINSARNTTMEQNALDGTGLSAGDQYCNVGNVHFDKDDDDGDGCYEESEVVFLGKVSGNVNYAFRTNFDRRSNAGDTGYINVIVQRSIYNPLNGEYEGWDYDLLEQADWVWGGYARSLTNNPTTRTSTIEAGEKHLVHDAGTTLEEMNNYFADQESVFSSLSAVQPLSETVETESTKVTVTFNRPISMDEMLALIEETGVSLNRYKAKFFNTDGEWCNASSSNTDEDAMIEFANESAIEAGRPHVSYEGIVSMEITMPAAQSVYEQLNNSPLVFCVDMSEYIWTHSEDYNPNIKILVPDYAWEVSNF